MRQGLIVLGRGKCSRRIDKYLVIFVLSISPVQYVSYRNYRGKNLYFVHIFINQTVYKVRNIKIELYRLWLRFFDLFFILFSGNIY